MYKTVKNSVELQYAIEVGAQRLMEIHPRPPSVSIAECLHTLKDKANAWCSSELRVTKTLHSTFLSDFSSITHQQLTLSHLSEHWNSHVVDLKTYMSALRCSWSEDSPNTVFRCIDEMRDFMVMVDIPANYSQIHGFQKFQYGINLHKASTGEKHPLAHGPCLITGRSFCAEALYFKSVVTAFLGDRLAFYGLVADKRGYSYWSLHVWNWHQGGPANVGVSFCLLFKVLIWTLHRMYVCSVKTMS